MKKFINIILTALLLLFVTAPVFADTYLPLNDTTALQALTDVRTAYYEEEFGSEWDYSFNSVIVVSGETNNSEYLATLGLTALEPSTWFVSFAWPDTYSVGSRFWEPPQEVLQNPNVPLYFVFNKDMLDLMSDEAVKGLLIHEMRHIVLWNANIHFNLQSLVGYAQGEKVVDNLNMCQDAPGQIISMYEMQKSMDALGMWPEGFDNLCSLSATQIKKQYTDQVDYLMFVVNPMYGPNMTPEKLVLHGLISQDNCDTYNYLQAN